MTQRIYSLLHNCHDVLNDFLANRIVKRLWIGYSGGRDSHVLLDLLVKLRQQKEINTEIVAIHVNHNLSDKANNWQEHCQRICKDYRVTLITEAIKDKPRAGDSIEAFARKARYQCIEKHLQFGDIFISAHHRRDQAETFLLQLMRGSGLDGLQAMPLMKDFGKGQYIRPLLHCDYNDIVFYAKQESLSFIEDSSNYDLRFDRNFLRHKILPLLRKRFPQAEKAISRSAAWLSEVPSIDAPSQLFLPGLCELNLAKQKQQIRSFIKEKTTISLSLKQTEYIIKHHLTAAIDKQPQLKINQYVVRRYNNELILTKDLPKIIANQFITKIDFAKNYDVSDFATLRWQSGQGGLVPDNYLLKPLKGSTKFHPHTRSCSTTVKKILHEYQIMPWLRPYMIGLYLGEQLVAIPNIGVAMSHYHKTTKTMMPLWIIRQEFVKM